MFNKSIAIPQMGVNMSLVMEEECSSFKLIMTNNETKSLLALLIINYINFARWIAIKYSVISSI